MNRDPFGAEGDFTTAPEISQMFGELIGLWAAEVWACDGAPSPVRLIELGPGRGTLMSDALARRARRAGISRRARRHADRDEPAARRDPARRAARPPARRSPGARSFAEAPDGPAIMLANEFLDALPIRQFVRARRAMARTGGASRRRGRARVRRRRQAGAVSSRRGATRARCSRSAPSAHRFMFELGARLAKQGGAALFIDYGHPVDRLRRHAAGVARPSHVDPLTDPGECDLTAHVDFAAMARSARAAGAAVHGPIDQGDFLRALGVDVRARALGERAPERAGEIEAARRRLVGKGDNEMGALFKAMVVANRAVPAPPGFQPNPAKPA